jgi:N-acetyl sugar amidotransferase
VKFIPSPEAPELSSFEPSATNFSPKYGLPIEVLFCKKCVISNQRPNSAVEYNNVSGAKKPTIAFDENGVCDACNFAERKKSEIDWADREQELIALCDKFRKSDGSYDCLVPGSGGKDSFYASHILKTKYRMNPLTVTWAPHIYTDWGWKNFKSWINSGQDNYLMTPNGRVHRLLTRLATDVLYHPFQPFMIGQKNLAPKMAELFEIPLVFYGENEAEYGNPISDTETPLRDSSYFTSSSLENVHLSGISVPDLIENFGLTLNDLQTYLPIGKQSASEMQVHYLGYYLKWHPQSAFYYAVKHGGFEAAPERTPGTYSKYNSIDDKIDDLHYYTTGVKYGLGRASYDAAQEIRSEDITREEGVALVRKFDHEYPERFMDELLDYLSIDSKSFPVAHNSFEEPIISRDYFARLTDSFRSPHLWVSGQDSWTLRNLIT